MKLKPQLILPVLLMIPMTCLYAVDDDNKSQEKPPVKQEQQVEQEQAKQKLPGNNSPDTFKPSEEISEDLAVSFPVDI